MFYLSYVCILICTCVCVYPWQLSVDLASVCLSVYLSIYLSIYLPATDLCFYVSLPFPLLRTFLYRARFAIF